MTTWTWILRMSSTLMTVLLCLGVPLKAQPALDTEFRRKAHGLLDDLGFSASLKFIEDSGYDLVEIYPELHFKASPRRSPLLVGYFIVEVPNLGRYWTEFEAYYDQLSTSRKARLRTQILAEAKLDTYVRQTREDLANAISTNDSIYKLVISRLEMIERFIARIRAEETVFNRTPSLSVPSRPEEQGQTLTAGAHVPRLGRLSTPASTPSNSRFTSARESRPSAC